MSTQFLSLTDIPAEGREFSFTDPDLWTDRWREFSLDCRMEKPLSAEIFILPQKDGWYMSGRLTGSIALPCSRCAADAVLDINRQFEVFETLPEEFEESSQVRKDAFKKSVHSDADDDKEVADESQLIHLGRNGPELDVSGLVWEQFQLTLPAKPLCKRECKGLCSLCGADLNVDPCDCNKEEHDPRLAVLRNIKIVSQ